MKKAILATLLSASTTAGAVGMCVNAALPDGAEVSLCRTDSLALCPQGTTNTYTGNLGSAAACDAVLDPYLSQRQRDIRAAQARTDAWLVEAQQMCQALAGQCVADRVAYMQAQWDAAQAAANTIMTTNPAPIQIAQPTTTPAMTTATTLPSRLPSSSNGSSSGAGYESAGSGYDGDGLSWGGRTKSASSSSGPYRSAAEWGALKSQKIEDESVKIAQVEPIKKNCDEFFETRANVEYWGSRDQKGNINNVCRKPVRK